MPKLSNRPPKYAKLKNYAVVYSQGKIHYLGQYGSEESKTAYARLVSESQANPTFLPLNEEASVTVGELIAVFLDYAKTNLAKQNYDHYRVVLGDFLLQFYGDVAVNDFRPSSLKTVRAEMTQSGRFCRRTLNDYTRRIISVFTWGIEMEFVHPNTVAALKAVKSLDVGAAGTFDHDEREDVPDEIIKRTLPFMPPTLRAMIQIQRLTGCRPSEIFNMQAGQIDKVTDPDLWLYYRPTHKTEKMTKRKKVIPLGKPEQTILEPFLTDKAPEAAVFSPQQVMQERGAERKANRKTNMTPSQIAKAQERAAKPRKYREFYNRQSYRQAVEYAIIKANKNLPEEEQIPHWTPYQVRHRAATAMELEIGLDEAQALLDHSSANTTKRYAHGRLEKLKELARNRQNPFDDLADESAE